MKTALLSVTLLLAVWPVAAQNQPPAPPTPATPTLPQAAPVPIPEPAKQLPPGAAIPPPKEVPSTVNTGRGFSIEPYFWRGKMDPIYTDAGHQNTNIDPGFLDLRGNSYRSIGAIVSIPIGKTNMLRVSHFDTLNNDGTVVVSNDLTTFKTPIVSGDLVFTRTRLQNTKGGLDYLTYFWKSGEKEFRVKTLWDVQYTTISSELTIIHTDPDSLIATASPGFGDRVSILPTVGLGLENTLSKHIRWEVKGSAMQFHSRIMDGEANIAFRFGHMEFVGGAKYFNFRTSLNSDHYFKGTVFGPYGGIRYYWKKQ
jgi:hypothetical protein